MTCVTLPVPRLQLCCSRKAVSVSRGRWDTTRASCPRLGRRLPCSLSLQAESAAIIREAQPEDLDALVYIEDHSRPGGNWNRRNLEGELLASGSVVLVAEKEQKAVGLLVAWRVPPDELHVLELAVLLEHRRQGLARQLMHQAVDLDRDRVQTVMLEVRASNFGAQQLYEQLGFKKVGLRRRYYANGEDAILMNLSVKVDSIA